MAPYDFYLFPTIKSALKGNRLQTVSALKGKPAHATVELTQEGFQYCVKQWKIRLERCRAKGEKYIQMPKYYDNYLITCWLHFTFDSQNSCQAPWYEFHTFLVDDLDNLY